MAKGKGLRERERVLCAMSGGVDSSVAALLLAEQGFAVQGFTMQLFDNELIGQGRESGCCSLNDIVDAREVCAALGIIHYTFSCQASFKAHVVERFCKAYLSGTTPNPCIDCNRYLKFEDMQKRRQEVGARYIATGHYARRCRDPKTGLWRLYRAKDEHKDQSYVLYPITQSYLAHMLFPLGELTKPQVRKIAQAHGFGNAQKRDSQDICFVPDGDYAAFIKKLNRGPGAAKLFDPGPIVDRAGHELGMHRGLVYYTIGQRKGIGIAHPKPLYVYAKDVAHNKLIVAEREELLVDAVEVEDLNLISGDYQARELSVEVKTSYRQKPVAALLKLFSSAKARIHFETLQVRPAPGQAAVIYRGNEVLGGGTIVERP